MVRNLDEDTVLNWYEAIEWAREGKKIRNSRWGSKDYYIYLNMDDVFVDEDGDRHAFDLPDFDEGTWEVYDPSVSVGEALEELKEFLLSGNSPARAFRDLETIHQYCADQHLLDVKLKVPNSHSGRLGQFCKLTSERNT